MAVTILQSPYAISLAYNPIRFKVQAEKLNPDGFSGAAYSVNYFGPVDAGDLTNLAVDDTIQLRYGGNLFLLTVKNVTTPEPDVIPLTKGAEATYSVALKNFLETNYFIQRHYTVATINDFQVSLTAKAQSDVWDLYADLDFAGAVDWDVTINTSGIAPQYVDNRYIRCDLYIENTYNSGNFNLYASLEQKIIDTDILWFDLSSKFKAYFADKNEKDQINYDGLKRLDNINKRYYVIFTEYDVNGYESTGDYKQSATLRAIKGGIKEDEWRIVPDVVEDYLKVKSKMITWRPYRRTIAPGQIDHVYFLNFATGVTTLKGKVTFYYSDDSDQTIIDGTLTPTHNGETYLWNVSYDRLAAKATIPTNESIRGIEVFWTNQADTELTDSVFFTVVEASVLDRVFFYESSWGVFESLITTSRHAYSFNVESEEVIAAIKPTDSYNVGELRQIVKGYVEEYSGSTGNIENLTEALVLTDFIISDFKYLKKGDRLINIIIPGGSYQPYEDDGYPHGFKFKYKRATEQEKYSELISIGFGGGELSAEEGEAGFEPS